MLTPRWLVVIGVVALLWNVVGLFALAMDAVRPGAHPLPGWAVAGGFFAVLAGAIASLGLVLRRRWAVPMLAVSLIGLVLQDLGLAMSPIALGAGAGAQTVVLAITILLLLIARAARRRRSLR